MQGIEGQLWMRGSFPFLRIFILYLTKYDIFSKVDLRANILHIVIVNTIYIYIYIYSPVYENSQERERPPHP